MPKAGDRAVNPATGARIVFNGSAWMPMASIAPSGGMKPPAMAGMPAVGPAAPPTPPPVAAPPPQSQFTSPSGGLTQAYEQDIAKPATDVTARAFTDVGERVQDPQKALAGLQNPMQYMQEALKSRAQGEISPTARTAAEMVIPQTPTAAALDVASLAMPALGVTNRLARVAGGIGTGMVAGALTGEGAKQGAGEGALAFGPGEVLSALAGGALNKTSERLMQKTDLTSVGKAISSALPWVGKLENPGDFENAFMKGDDSGAIKTALDQLHNVKTTLAQRMKGHTFLVPTPDGMKRLPFQVADKLASDLQAGYGFTLGGQMRAGYTSRESRAIAHQIREHLSDGLNLAKQGLGEAYRKVGRQYDAAKTLTRMLGPDGLLTPNGLSQPELLKRLRGMKDGRLQYDLDRSIGRGTRDRLIKILGGAAGAKDIPSKPGHHSWMGNWKGHLIGGALGGLGGEMIGHPAVGAAVGGLLGGASSSGGQKFIPSRPAPVLPFTGSPFEIGISNLIGEQLKPADGTKGPGVELLDKTRAEHLAPTPSASKRAVKLNKEFEKGKIPEVHKDLNRGRLSMDETNKLIKTASSTDNAAMVQGMPLSELLDALEQANPEERQMLLPLVKQRLMAELPQQQNKTLQANLSQRFQRIQQVQPQAEA